MSRPDLHINTGHEDEEMISSQDEYSDEGESSSASIDPDIDFDLNYALHTFVATVEGQASVVKGDSLVLLDDTNSYWWLVNVLKTEDVGYIPAENIETPYERLARLNKFRNVDIAAATQEEKNIGLATSRLQLRNVLSASKASPGSRSPSPSEELSPENGGRRGIKFAAPTYVEHPGNQGWSDDDEDDEEGEGYEEGEYDEEGEGMEGEELDEDEMRRREEELENGGGSSDNHGTFAGMEPDDGMSWDDDAGQEDRHERQMLAATGMTPSASFSSAESMDDSQVQGGPRARQAEVVSPQQREEDQGITFGPEATADAAPRSSAQQQQQAELGRGIVPPSQQQQQQQHTRSISASSVQSKASSLGESPVITSQSTFASAPSREFLDPALETGETRRIHATPAVARTPPQGNSNNEAFSDAPRNVSLSSMRSSGELPDMGYERETDRDEEASSPNGGKKARREEEDKSKKKGVFGSLFRKKDKKDKGIRASTVISDTERDSYGGRSSEDDSTVRSPSSTFQDSPPAGPGRPSSSSSRVSMNSTDPKRSNSTSSTTGPGGMTHGLRLQEIDQKQQALYHQYLSSAVTTTPERAAHPSLSYGTQAAAAVAQSTASQRLRNSVGQSSPRPGSLLVTSTSVSMANAGLAGAAAANLSVLRIFAGQGVESDSTFKTVLLKETTTTDELVKQAIQRFRLGSKESADDYVLIVKGVDGQEEVLGAEGHPLVVFNSLNQEDTNLVKTIRRSSAGSISSISSNLSLNPAIARLGDWSDDSLVKLYISRRTDNLNASASNTSSLSAGDFLSAEPLSPLIGSGTQAGRFTLQVVIRPEDLPDGMMFDTASEAIVPRPRRMSMQPASPSLSTPSSPSLSQTERLRFFLLPANTTVAEAIEVALDRFGIAEGVVDGGDEVEDKLSKRKSVARVRYGLSVRAAGEDERVLHPSTKLVDSYSTPPTYRTPPSADAKERRRSREIPTAHPEDVQPSDPVFIIRRAVPRGTNLSLLSSPRRSRSSVLMDTSRNSTLSDRSIRAGDKALSAKASASSLGSERTAGPGGEDTTATINPAPSRQEIIAAQRAASRANQLAILSANTNASQGIDLVMSDRGTVRSSRLLSLATGGEQVRYSYIEPDGETTYDISELIEEEWTPTATTSALTGGASGGNSLDIPRDGGAGRAPSPSEGDVLEGALRDPQGRRPVSAEAQAGGEIDQKIGRVLQKVREGSVKPLATSSTSSPLPGAIAAVVSAVGGGGGGHRKQQSSITSSMSRSSPSPSTNTNSPSTSQDQQSTQPSSAARSNPTPPNPRSQPLLAQQQRGMGGRPLLVMRDDFGIKGMMAVIHARAREPVSVKGVAGGKRRDEVEERMFGVRVAGAGNGGGLGGRFDDFDRELDRLLDGVWKGK